MALAVRLFATLALTIAALAGQQSPAPSPRFRSDIELVHLDVSVLDRNRRPVRGLTPADFTILENGRPQPVVVFKAVDIPEPEPPSAPWLREVAPDVRSNEGIEDRRLFLLVMDDAAMQADPRAANNGREIARRVIDGLGPSDLAAVVFTRDSRNSQDYTADRTRLRAAVDHFSIGFRDMTSSAVRLPNPDQLYFSYSVDVLERAVELLSTVPDRRKSIVYVGQGVPVDIALLAPQSPGLPETGEGSGLSAQGLFSDLLTRMQRTFQRAARANVNVYTIDVCGLRAPGTTTCQPGLEVDYLKTVAANTGARSVTDTNSFESGIRAIFEENASYYLVGYQSSDPAKDGKFRRIDVRVNRPNLEVRTRSGYQSARDESSRHTAPPAPLATALSGLVPKSDLPLQLTAVPFAVPGKRESAVAIVIGIRQPLVQASGPRRETLDLQVSAFDGGGKEHGTARLRADVALKPDATGFAEYELLVRLDLKPGRYQLRVAGNAISLSTSGSLYADLDVPDVSAKPVSLSPIVFSASPGPVVGSKDDLRSIVPVVPTARRSFGPGAQVLAFTRVYQGGKAALAAVPVRIQLRNAGNELVVDRREELAAPRFSAARSADVSLALPVARLSPGEYLLSLEAGTVRRDTRFAVVR
jgi:VWFA-related protein